MEHSPYREVETRAFLDGAHQLDGVEQLFETVEDIDRQGRPIRLVEQNAAMALTIARRG